MQKHDAGSYFVPSDRLTELRRIVELWKDMGFLAHIFQMRLVVDANVILSDVRWLATKRRSPAARTALLEVLECGTLQVYVPRQLYEEVGRHIDRFSAEEDIDRSRMLEGWAAYQKHLNVLDPDEERIRPYRAGVDPDDAVFLALADTIGAKGILSNDRHISQMGGKRISIDCVFSLRDYSRAAAIEWNIKVAGVTLGVLGFHAISEMFSGIRNLGHAIARAPDWVKVSVVIGALLLILHPGARKKISSGLEFTFGALRSCAPPVFSMIMDAAAHAYREAAVAQLSLDKALEELGEPSKRATSENG
jgi:predicted nucleic acid-binding protein